MIGLVVVAVLLVWLIVSALTAAVVRGGVAEDRARGYLTYRS